MTGDCQAFSPYPHIGSAASQAAGFAGRVASKGFEKTHTPHHKKINEQMLRMKCNSYFVKRECVPLLAEAIDRHPPSSLLCTVVLVCLGDLSGGVLRLENDPHRGRA